jgi:hypothetical protein
MIRVLIPKVGCDEAVVHTNHEAFVDVNLAHVIQVRDQVKQRVQTRMSSFAVANQSMQRCVSSLWMAYDDLGLDGALSSYLMCEGIAIRIHLPLERNPPPLPNSDKVTFAVARIIHLYLDASCCGTDLEHVQLAVEAAFLRVARALLRSENANDAVDQNSSWSRLPNALVSHVANHFLADADAQQLARCDTRTFLILRKSYLLKEFVRVSKLDAHHPLYTFYWQPTSAEITTRDDSFYKLSKWTRLAHVMLDGYLNQPTPFYTRMQLPNTVISLTLNFWDRPIQELCFPPRLSILRVGKRGHFNADLRHVTWPASLHTIDLRSNGYWRFNFVRGTQFPSCLHTLMLSDHCHFGGVVLPRSLRVFHLTGADLDKTPLADLDLPDELTELSLRTLWGLHPSPLPTSLVSLTLTHGAESAQGYVLPPALTQLKLGGINGGMKSLEFLVHLSLPMPMSLQSLVFRTWSLKDQDLVDALAIIQRASPQLRVEMQLW